MQSSHPIYRPLSSKALWQMGSHLTPLAYTLAAQQRIALQQRRQQQHSQTQNTTRLLQEQQQRQQRYYQARRRYLERLRLHLLHQRAGFPQQGSL